MLILRLLSRAIWGNILAIPLCLAFVQLEGIAAQEPVMRVFLKESTKLRFRADSNIPILIKGLNPREKKANFLTLKISNGQLMWSIDSTIR